MASHDQARFGSMIQAAKEVNPEVVIWYHSCGHIEPIIPDLIEIGVEVLNPIQPEAMDPARSSRSTGIDWPSGVG